MRHAPIAAVILGALAACNEVPWSRAPEATVAAGQIEAFPPDATLRDGLDMIGAVLDSAIASQLDDAGVRQLLRAESLSDRVLETHIPFGWLTAADYSVEARVWQIQARADRIVARFRADARRDELLPELQALRADVAALRAAISDGGEPAPAPIDRLLQRLDSATRQAVPPGV